MLSFQENQSSDSFYDSDNADQDSVPAASTSAAVDDEVISKSESADDSDVDGKNILTKRSTGTRYLLIIFFFQLKLKDKRLRS